MNLAQSMQIAGLRPRLRMTNQLFGQVTMRGRPDRRSYRNSLRSVCLLPPSADENYAAIGDHNAEGIIERHAVARKASVLL